MKNDTEPRSEPRSELHNQLKAVRTRLGMSQQDLAAAAGVARQTIGGIEAETYALSLSVALRLAKVLGCPVEELFWLEENLPTVEVRPITSPIALETGLDKAEPVRVALAQVAGQWVATPLHGKQGYRREMIPADGVGVWDADKNTLNVRLLDTAEALSQTVLIAGCTPALSLWARSAERWHPGLRVHWLHANSMAALAHLARGEVHMAGVHLFDPQTGQDNRSFVSEVMSGTPTVLVNLGVWEEGLVVAPGNPKGLQRGADLAQAGVRLINREAGAGSRRMLDDLLTKDGVLPVAVAGYDTVAEGHLEVAQAVQGGQADVGVSTAAVAAGYGLSFVPVRSVRYDLALRKAFLMLPAVQQLLGTLHHRWVRSQLATLGGYNTTQTGEVVEVA